jgi:apolipoprotein N-acyltransferase
MLKVGQDPVFWAAVLAGLLAAGAFPPIGFWPLILVSPVPLLWALDRTSPQGWRRGFVLGWTAGAVQFVAMLYWILALPSEEYTIPGLMVPAWLFLSAFLAVFHGVAAAAASAVARRLRVSVALVWPVFATLAEAARGHGELAFPWGANGYALARATPLLQFTSVTGFWGLVLWINLAAGLLVAALRCGPRSRRLLWGAWALVFAFPWIHGAMSLQKADGRAIDGDRGVRIALIQPNTSRTIKWDPRFRELVITDLLARTRHAAASRPDLIVWPETAVPMVLLKEPVQLARVCDAVDSLDIPLLAGTLDQGLVDGKYVAHNSVALIDADGQVVERYDKQRLVPFSEKMPFDSSMPWLSGLNFGQSDFSSGTRDVLFSVAGGRFACLICFESIFPDMARKFAREGASILVNVTNDFWFGDTAAPLQHADMAVFRAVETRTPLLRCANTGVSMVVDPYGRVTHRTRTFVEAEIQVRVLPASGMSFYVRHGEWLLRGLIALAAAMAIAAAFARRGGG